MPTEPKDAVQVAVDLLMEGGVHAESLDAGAIEQARAIVIGPLTPLELLDRMAASGGPGSLYAQFCADEIRGNDAN